MNLLRDDIVQWDIPCLKQLISQYEQTGSSVIGVKTVNDDETHRYGIVAPITFQINLFKV
jgi:UTP--glucose-1-phosphate uridylyltransferase